MSRAIVVGGGLSGLCACRLLQPRHEEIVLIERDSQLGGLLKSDRNALGQSFDQGTHFITATSIPDLNQLLFEDLDDEDCFLFEGSLREGSFFNGRLSATSGCIDTRSLPPDLHARGLVEILSAQPQEVPAENLEEHLAKNYGETLTGHVFEPTFSKLLKTPLDQLHRSALDSFLLTRLVVLDNFASREIKRSPVYDQKIAWTHFEDGSSEIIKRYPKRGGVGVWAEGLEDRIRRDGVRILTGRTVSRLAFEDNRLRSLDLDDGQTLLCDEAVWTVPPVNFLRSGGIPLNSAKPSFRNIVLLHFSIDSQVNTDLHWVCNYDPDYLSYRITLYPNITTGPRTDPPHHLTVEVLTDDYDIETLKPRIFEEVKTMGLIPNEAGILDSFHKDVRPGWPVITSEFKKDAEAAMKLAQNSASNVTFVGRGKGDNSHFLQAVLEDLYHSLS